MVRFIHDFCSKYFAPREHNKTPNTTLKLAKHYFLNLQFISSPFAVSRILSFKQSPYNLLSGIFSKHYSCIHNQVVKKWYTKIFGKFSSEPKYYSTQITAKVHHPTLSKLFLLCPKYYPYLQELKHRLYHPLLVGGLSYYYRNSAKLFKNYLNSFQFSRFVKHVRDHPTTLYLLGFGIVTVLSIQKIPYSKRRHVVLVPQKLLKWIGDKEFQFIDGKSSILPDTHPDSVRVRSISNRIIEALERDLQVQRRNVLEKNANGKEIVKEPRRRRNRYYVKHLEGLDWEVMVVKKSYESNAYCLPGGKIVVYTGLLRDLKSDEEIATVIAHEVGHVVARHRADKLTKLLIASLLVIFMKNNEARSSINSNGMGILVNFFISRPWSRRCEKEADYIGLQLMATAGYDPEKASRVHEMFDGNESKTDFFSTHPSGKKRAKALTKDEVMKEANARYCKAIRLRFENPKP